jgi:DNA polymerase-3 subunit gamma/tau
MTYQVLARAWRPQRFEELLGQEAVVQTLRNALASGTLGHAYLFSGLRGVGKTTAARLLAKAVNCAEARPRIPAACGLPGDRRRLEPRRGGVDGATHTGSRVRDLQSCSASTHPRPLPGVIVDEVHMLSRRPSTPC